MCTGIQMTALDGAVIGARTLEFERSLASEIIVVPAGTEYQTAPPRGMTWTAIYGAVGANIAGRLQFVEGINEKGLSAGAFFFPGYASFTPIDKVSGDKSLSPMDVVSWILTTCATLDDVSKSLPSMTIAAPTLDASSNQPLHYLVRDPQGGSLAIEYTNEGTLTIYPNLVGVFTNSPPFDWHVTNLNNYINLGPDNVEKSSTLRIELTQIGQGTGLLGLPGDFTPPSRFVRAAFYVATAQSGKTADDTVKQMFHILNLFDIPLGTVRDGSKEDHTEWTSASDMKNLVFYIKTLDNQQVRYVEVRPALKAAWNGPITVSLTQKEHYDNITPAS